MIWLSGCGMRFTETTRGVPRLGDEGGRDTTLCFVELSGRLYPYRVYFPGAYRHAQKPDSPDFRTFPLLVACHSSDADESAYFEWKGDPDRIQTIAEERGYVVACPAAPDRHWHDRDWTEEKARQGVVAWRSVCKNEGVAVIMELVREMVKQRWIDEGRVYLMGASSGAIATYGTASLHPERFAAVAGVCGLFTDDMTAGLTRVPVMVFAAQKDKLFAIERVRGQVRKLADAGGNVILHETPGGHGGYRNLESYKVLFDFFDSHRREAAGTEADELEN